MYKNSLSTDEYQNALKTAWRHFIKGEDFDYSFIRKDILNSWKRSRDFRVEPVNINYVNLNTSELNFKINRNLQLINTVHPYLEKLFEMVKGSGSYILLCDKDGYIIDYKGDEDIIAQGNKTKLGMGSMRSEQSVGTNGIGTALYLKKPIQIWGEEHYSQKHKEYTCSGAPFFDTDGTVAGCLNVTVNMENAHPHTLGMVVCAADSITNELKLRQAMKNIELVNTQRNSIIENMTSGVILLNPLHRIVQINQYALHLLGFSYEEIIGQNLFDFITIDNHDDYTSHLVLEKEAYNEEVSVFTRTHSTIPKRLNLSINHIKDVNGNISSMIVRFNKPEMLNKIVKSISGFKANYNFNSIIGTSVPMMHTIDESRKAAESNSNVLILGESGTGKELIAQSIHNASSVASGPFVAINCATIPNSLVESELFGYEKGAFTGANNAGQPGKFELADGGTVFLDEIGDMPLNVQATLLRVIQTKEVVRIGGKFPKPIDIRIIAATNKNLLEAVNNKSFRQDLFYRLNVITIEVPTLATRGPEDIRVLSEHFIYRYNQETDGNVSLSEAAANALERYNWPGNVRQLENVIERAINLRTGDVITTDCISIMSELSAHDNVHEAAAESASADNSSDISNHNDLNVVENEKGLIIKALTETSGNVANASELLHMNKRTLYRKLDKYDLSAKKFKQERRN